MNTSMQPPPVQAECHDTSEKIELYENYGIYIKPIARLNITIQLPPNKNPGQTISFPEIVDKLKQLILPEEFIYLRVIKSSLEFIRLEGEVENKSSFKILLSKLDNVTIKLSSYIDVLKVRAAEAKIVYPNRHDWDSFFKDSMVNNEELKPGERADTIHLTDLPCKWFADKKNYSQNTDVMLIKPNEHILREVFSIFGEIRLIDVPILNNCFTQLRRQSAIEVIASTGMLNLPTFEAYIQYKDYIGFVKAMDTFRGMKLLYIDEQKNAFTANFRIDFDRTKHLSDREIKKREIDKLKAIEIEKIRNATIEREKEKENKQKEITSYKAMLDDSIEDDDDKKAGMDEKSKEQRRREREEARRQKRLAKKQHEEERKLEQKIAFEERKILIAQRKLESMRLLEELFNRVKDNVEQEENEKKQKEIEHELQKRQAEEADLEMAKKLKMELEEAELKEKIAKNLEKRKEDDEEVEHFELRKDTVIQSDIKSPKQASQDAVVLPPRAVLLSNPKVQPIQVKPTLYDDEINHNENRSDGEIENVIESQNTSASTNTDSASN